MSQRTTSVEQQSLRFWLSTWIPQQYPTASASYDLLPRDDGRWNLTLYPSDGKERTGVLWGTVIDGVSEIQITWDDEQAGVTSRIS